MEPVLKHPSADANTILFNLKAKLSCSEHVVKPPAVIFDYFMKAIPASLPTRSQAQTSCLVKDF